MNTWIDFINRMNVLLWTAVMFLFHLILYLSLGEDDWLMATLLATGTYALAFVLLKSFARRKKRGVQ